MSLCLIFFQKLFCNCEKNTNFAVQSTFNYKKHMEKSEALNTLNEIRDMMAKSSKVLSLSGTSSVFVGVFAIIAAYIANCILENESLAQSEKTIALMSEGALLLCICITTVFLFSKKKANKNNMSFRLDQTTQQMLWHFALPLAVGGVLCLTLVMNSFYGLTSSMMLIFYGLALYNASSYTYSNAKYLGLANIVLGLVDCATGNHAILFWALGFGVCHIIYGIFFYFKHERN